MLERNLRAPGDLLDAARKPWRATPADSLHPAPDVFIGAIPGETDGDSLLVGEFTGQLGMEQLKGPAISIAGQWPEDVGGRLVQHHSQLIWRFLIGHELDCREDFRARDPLVFEPKPLAHQRIVPVGADEELRAGR